MVLFRDSRRRRRNSYSLNRTFAAAATNHHRTAPLVDHGAFKSEIPKSNNFAVETTQPAETVEESIPLHITNESASNEGNATMTILLLDDDRDTEESVEPQQEEEVETPQSTTVGNRTTFPMLEHNLPTIQEINSADELTGDDKSSITESSLNSYKPIPSLAEVEDQPSISKDQDESCTKDSLRYDHVYETLRNMVNNAKELKCRSDDTTKEREKEEEGEGVEDGSASLETMILLSKVSDLTEEDMNSLSYSESDVSCSCTQQTVRTDTNGTGLRDASTGPTKDRSSSQKFNWDVSMDILWDENDDEEMAVWNTDASGPPPMPEIDNDLFSTSTLTSTLGMSKGGVTHTEDTDDWSTIDNSTIGTKRTANDSSFVDSSDGSAFDEAVHVSMIDSLARESSSLWDASCVCSKWNHNFSWW